jgi:hypothetical protein
MGANFSKTVAPGGIQDSQEGLDYQWKSLVLFASRCFSLQHIVKSFAVLTEIQEAEKFDDMILEYTSHSNNDTKYILAQAKHKKTAEAMDSRLLIASKNFGLVKYFASFWEISQKFGVDKIENVMILTNNTLAGSQVTKAGQIMEMNIFQTSESLYFEKTSHFIFGSIGENFKFVDKQKTERTKVFKIVKMILLSYELASLCIKTPRNNFLSHNQKYLFDTIIDGNSLIIKQDFLNGTLLGLEFFSQTFDQALKAISTQKDKIDKIQNQFPNIFNTTIDNFLLSNNQNNADDAINEFLDKLLYVTKLENEDLQNEIDLQLRETFKRENVQLVSASVEVCLKTWFMGEKNIELTRPDFESFITKSQIEIASMKMIVLKNESFRDALAFSSVLLKVGHFINNTGPNQSRILRLETPESEIHFAAMRILANHSAEKEDALMFLTTSYNDDNFNLGIEVFEKLNSYKLMVIEIYTFQVFKRHESSLRDILQNDSSKKIVLIGYASLNVNLQSMQTLFETESFFTDLGTQSQDEVLDETIRFQDTETTWRAVLDGHDLSKILLKDVVKSRQLGNEIKVSKSYSEKIYIPRTILYNNCLKPLILQRNNEESKDVFVFDKDEFEKERWSLAPHHLLQRSDSHLEWIESNRDISIILNYIDEETSRSNSEDELTKRSAHITIISDVAGMGKSSLFCKLCEVLKEHEPDCWIYKLDLNDHSEALDELTNMKLQSPKEAVRFIGQQVIKFKSNFERNHFTDSCFETGKVILLVDGFDEIFGSYGDEVLDLIKLLAQTKIKKLLISTRPECCERLEMEFLQIKHSLQPFSESDQKAYFLSFLKNSDKFRDSKELEEIVGAFLESMKRSIRAKDYRHTGVPLITKLVAEYLEDKIPSMNRATTFSNTVDKLRSEKFNLWCLYENFISKSFDIYFKEKCGIDVKKAIQRSMQSRTSSREIQQCSFLI